VITLFGSQRHLTHTPSRRNSVQHVWKMSPGIDALPSIG